MIKTAQDAVKEFNKASKLPIAESPNMLAPERLKLRIQLLHEETEEFAASKEIEDQADALIDIIYVALGALVEMGVDGESIFSIVHDANMKKIGSNGEVVFSKNGKVLKPQGWVSPREMIKSAIASCHISTSAQPID